MGDRHVSRAVALRRKGLVNSPSPEREGTRPLMRSEFSHHAKRHISGSRGDCGRARRVLPPLYGQKPGEGGKGKMRPKLRLIGGGRTGSSGDMDDRKWINDPGERTDADFESDGVTLKLRGSIPVRRAWWPWVPACRCRSVLTTYSMAFSTLNDGSTGPGASETM